MRSSPLFLLLPLAQLLLVACATCPDHEAVEAYREGCDAGWADGAASAAEPGGCDSPPEAQQVACHDDCCGLFWEAEGYADCFDRAWRVGCGPPAT